MWLRMCDCECKSSSVNSPNGERLAVAGRPLAKTWALGIAQDLACAPVRIRAISLWPLAMNFQTKLACFERLLCRSLGRLEPTVGELSDPSSASSPCPSHFPLLNQRLAVRTLSVLVDSLSSLCAALCPSSPARVYIPRLLCASIRVSFPPIPHHIHLCLRCILHISLSLFHLHYLFTSNKMVKIATAAAGALVLAASAAAQATINTPPSLTQCQPAALQWSGATGTVRLSVLPAGEVSAAPIANLPDQTGSSGSYVWTVNIPSGTNITISINDGSGVANYASPLVVLPSSDSSCLSGSSSSSSGAAGGAASSTSAASSSAASATSRASSSAASATSSAAQSSSRAPSSQSTGASPTSSAPAQTSSGAANAAAAFSPSTAGLSVLAVAGAILPFL